MPPPLFEDDESSAEEIPYKNAPANGADEADEADEAGDDESEDDDDDAPDEYVVEKILKHDWTEDGTLLFEVKWMGYEEAADRTWEPEENLETASDVLKAYFKKIGGRPAKPQAKGKKSKKRGAETTPPKRHGKKSKLSTPEVASKTAVTTSARKGKKGSIEDDWKPPGGTWENNVVDVDTIEEAWDSEQGEMVRFAYIMWDNGRKTRHMLPTLNQKCPQKMLQYYESHLVFRQADTISNGAPSSKTEEQAADEPKAKRTELVK